MKRSITYSLIFHLIALAYILSFQKVEEPNAENEPSVDVRSVALNRTSVPWRKSQTGENGGAPSTDQKSKATEDGEKSNERAEPTDRTSDARESKVVEKNESPSRADSNSDRQKTQTDKPRKWDAALAGKGEESASTEDPQASEKTSDEQPEKTPDVKKTASTASTGKQNAVESGQSAGELAARAGDSESPGGSGSGTGVGSGDGDGGVDRQSLIRQYGSTVYKLVNRRLEYPPMARRSNLEGTVLVRVVINRHGKILNVKLADSSGHEVLDSAAVELLKSINQLPTPPKKLAWRRKQLELPLRYSLG